MINIVYISPPIPIDDANPTSFCIHSLFTGDCVEDNETCDE